MADEHESPSGTRSVREDDTPDPGDVLPTHSADGVDLTLIRWMLAKTPAERLRALTGAVRSLDKLRHARRNP